MKKTNRTKRVKRLRKMAAGVMATTVALTGGSAAFASAPTDGGEQVTRAAVTSAPAVNLVSGDAGTTYSKWKWNRTGTRTGTGTVTTPTTTPTKTTTPTTTPTRSATAQATADRVVDIALGLQGRVQYGPYNESTLSMDCSGFTYYVFKQAGIDLGSRDDDLQVNLGTYVPRSQLQKGDLIFLWNESSTSKTDVGHVGIYIGDGKYIHAANSSLDVVVTNVNSGWAADHYITARRVIQ